MQEMNTFQLEKRLHELIKEVPDGSLEEVPLHEVPLYTGNLSHAYSLLGGLAWQSQCYRNKDGSLKEHRVDISDPTKDGSNVFVIHQQYAVAVCLAYYLFRTGHRVKLV